MTKPKSAVLGIACLVLLAFGISLLTTTPAPAAPPPPPTPAIPVSVVNTPLPVQGSVNANVSGSVSVSNSPTVTLSSGSSVSINSSEFNPIFVDPDASAANNPHGGGTPAQGGSSLSPYQGGENNCTNFQTIPPGYRLVVESISLSAQVPAGTTVINAYFGVNQGPIGGVTPEAYLVPVKVSSDTASDYWVASSPIRGYFTAGTPVGVGITTTPSFGGLTPFNLQCVAFGHLVPGS
jgi:hypothetical protein